MGENQSLKWERIQTSFTSSMSPHDLTYRSKLPGGWLVRYAYTGGAGKSASAIIYIADTIAEWAIVQDKAVWEPVESKRTSNDDLKIFRMQVPGGWIVREGYLTVYRHSHESKINHLSISMTFVPDNKHEWIIEDLTEIKPSSGRDLEEKPDEGTPSTGYGGTDF